MKRREFLISGIGAATTALLGRRLGSAQVISQNRKVIIIGAGLSGLVSAYELRKLNCDVTVLEAQSRPGGRVLTLRTFDEPGIYAEAGAARIPHDHDLTLKYVREFDLQLESFYPSVGKFLRLRGGRPEQLTWNKFAEASWFVHLDKPEEWQKIRGGNDHLPRAFAAKLGNTIHYDAPVVKIEQAASNVTVKFKEKDSVRSMTADVVICAIPFTMLLKLEISPAFSRAKIDSINSLEYDSASRAFIETKKRSWREQQLNGYAFGDDGAEVWESTFQQSGTHGILQNYLRGEYAIDLMKKTEPERVRSTMEKLGKLFPDLQSNFVKGVTKCWDEDPWVLGAWAHPDRQTLEIGARPEGRIFFAGEHLSNTASWMQGALESGLRVVKEVASARMTV
ncbi:MAG TPA: FAD-dependent oxidoreductase [Pyrinomonadaceae bacterium]|nr:FAD-dependent oxidoreductase [Pyrinomonadaceae bacterium]